MDYSISSNHNKNILVTLIFAPTEMCGLMKEGLKSSSAVPQGTSSQDTSTPSTPSIDSLPSPLVFQCGKCRIIIGDSFSFSSSSQQNQTITLASASNIKRIPEFHTSTTGYDVLSSYVMFHCENCEVAHLIFHILLTVSHISVASFREVLCHHL